MASTSKIVRDYNDIFIDYDPNKNTTRNILTKYEKTAVLSLRLEQLMRGGAPCIDVEAMGLTNIRDIALAELESRKIPFLVMRTLPGGQKEYWKLADMIILRD
jgi:DNA-directed RNA polymerase subunit K/omega